MTTTPGKVAENIKRVLDYYGFTEHLDLTPEHVIATSSRIFCFAKDTFVWDAVQNGKEWTKCPPVASKINHGTKLSYRERGVSPSMQISFHNGTTYNALEIDLDFYSPRNGLKGFFGHAWEVIKNKVTGNETNQDEMHFALDRRFKS